MFSTRNNLFVLLAIALMGFSMSLMSSQQDAPQDKRWFGSLRGPLKPVTDAERKDGAQQAEAQKSSWFAVSHNINVDKDAIGKVQTAFEELKALAARLVRQNEIRTLLRDTQGKLASIVSTAEGQSTSTQDLFAHRNTEQSAKEQKRAAETALIDSSLSHFRNAKEQFINWQATFNQRILDLNKNDEYAKDNELAEVLKAIAEIAVKCDDIPKQATCPAFVQALKELKNEVGTITQNFIKKTLIGGLSDSLTEQLGKILDKAVANLTTDFSKQFKIQLNEVVGYTALIKIAEKLNALVLNKQASIPEITHELASAKAELSHLISLVKQGNKLQTDESTKQITEEKGDLQKALEKIVEKIEALNAKYRDSSMSLNEATRTALMTEISIIKNEANAVLSRHGGLAVALRDSIDRLNDGFDKTLDRNIKQLNAGIDRSLKKFVINACCGALAVYSTVFLMKHWRNPVDRRIGLGTLAGSLICMPIINKLANWFNK